MKTLAIVGVSGAGKSTFLVGLQERAMFRHLTASALIKSEVERDGGSPPSSEALRKGDVGLNQKALITAFHRERDATTVPLILDGHTVIDTPAGVTEILPDVFLNLGIDHIVFLQASPAAILRQRDADLSRSRPQRTLEQLDELQSRSLIVAARIARELGIPLTVLTAAQESEFIELLS